MESGIWYGMFVLSGSIAIAAATTCPSSIFAAVAAIVGAWSAREYLSMGDEARFF